MGESWGGHGVPAGIGSAESPTGAGREVGVGALQRLQLQIPLWGQAVGGLWRHFLILVSRFSILGFDLLGSDLETFSR